LLRFGGVALDCLSHHKFIFLQFREDLIALPGKREIFFCNSSLIMGGESQRHLIKTDVDIRMMIAFLSSLCDAIDKIYAF
jgi:hypothetical protein